MTGHAGIYRFTWERDGVKYTELVELQEVDETYEFERKLGARLSAIAQSLIASKVRDTVEAYADNWVTVAVKRLTHVMGVHATVSNRPFLAGETIEMSVYTLLWRRIGKMPDNTARGVVVRTGDCQCLE